MSSFRPVKMSSSDKLRVLRRLDQFRTWDSLDEQRQCIQCGQIITGCEIEVVGGTRGLGPLHLQCPTENCPAIPMDWIMPPRRLETKPVEPAILARNGSVSPVAPAPRVATGRLLAGLFGGRKFSPWGM